MVHNATLKAVCCVVCGVSEAGNYMRITSLLTMQGAKRLKKMPANKVGPFLNSSKEPTAHRASNTNVREK